MRFEWDESKNKANISKHGIDFNDVPDIFGIRCWPCAMIERIMVRSVGSVSVGSNC